MWQDLQDSVIYVAGTGIVWELAMVIAGGISLAMMRIVSEFVRTVMRWD